LRYFIDTEYFDDCSTVELVAIGVVAEDGREFFAVSADFDDEKPSPWLRANVLPLLPPRTDSAWMGRVEIRDRLRAFVGTDAEFWSVCAEWDWYLLVRLFGGLNDLPPSWPMTCWDLWQRALHLGNPPLPKHTGREHHALEDARWHKQVYEALAEAERVSPKAAR
jgi:hypothetical protein